MDSRFKKATIFDRRQTEWNPDRIKSLIDELFEKINLVDGWEFVKSEWIKFKSKSAEELKRHIMKSLKITVKNPRDKEISYIIQLPELIEGQFFYIGGYLKVPIFQLIDDPIIFRASKGTTNLLKLKTNTLSVSIVLSKRPLVVSVFGKKIQLADLVSAIHTEEEIDEFMSQFKGDINPELEYLLGTCKTIWKDTTQEERVNKLGSYFYASNIDESKKGNSVIFSFRAAYEVDIFSRPFFKTSSLILELLNAMQEGERSDTNIKHKRIRYSEYILFPLVKKIYDMLVTLKNNKTVKFQIPKSIIEDGCNISDIVHFNFTMNPVGEIASMIQCSLTGPGGFKKDNVPAHLRTLDDSQFGVICPADTPDRDGCGVILNMVPNVGLNELGKFKDTDGEIVTSFPITLTPFMKNDDQTRLQMASNQTKQAILLKKSEKPLIRTGVEGSYMNKTTFLYNAKDNGKVVHLDPTFMVVLYDNGEKDVFKTYYRTLYQNTIDFLEPMKKEGETFKKGDILCQSKFLKDGELSLGRNLTTGIAIWKGYNYEDGIVLSETASKKLVSVHSVDLSFSIDPGQILLSLGDNGYSPIPKIGQKLKQGEVYAKIKTLDSDDGFEAINIDPFEKYSPTNCTVTSIEIYPNGWNKKVSEYNLFIQELMTYQGDRFIQLINKLCAFMDEDEIEKFITLHGLSRLDCNSRKGKYSFKGQKVTGVYIKVNAVYEEKIGIGDKIANRHGNKGIISRIIPDEKMPVLDDGRKLEVILNPLGIISRMNAGQLFELHLNEAFHNFRQNLRAQKESIRNDVKMIKEFMALVDKTPKAWATNKIIKEYKKDFKGVGRAIAINNLYIMQPPFQSIHPKELDNIMKFTGSEYKTKLFDPETKLELKNPIAMGYIYFLKLVHRASEKMAARSIGPYSKKTLQPLGGKSKMGGQRLGEMEVWALMSHGSMDYLRDLLTVHSDSPGLKNRLLSEILQNPNLISSDELDIRPQSLRLLSSYFKILGVDLEEDEEECQ